MSPEAQRIAVAEACGWREVAIRQGDWHPRGFHPNNPQGRQRIPDYLNDLNAMHEAEQGLTPEQWGIYEDILIRSAEFVWHATAAQRCEALLRTIGKWTDA